MGELEADTWRIADGTEQIARSRALHCRRRGDHVHRLSSGYGASCSQELIGRADELNMIWSFVGEVRAGGATLVLSGEPGMGKTVMLDAAAAASCATGLGVLRAVGAEFETNLSFSSLNQLLSPLRSEMAGLPAEYQDALRVALGFGTGPRPDQLIISNATVALFERAALMHPLLVIIDDLQWLDRVSAAVLVFAARRGVARLGFLWAIRSGRDTTIECGGLPTHVLRPISDDAAVALLESRFPILAPQVRQRLIVEAEGNPLALVELPTALSRPQLEAIEALPDTLPLSARLQALFEGRIKCLPSRTRRVLLLAALSGAGELQVLQALLGETRLLDDLAAAERDRLIFVDDVRQRVSFRHPLIRSCVVELATGGERSQAHLALARVLLNQPDRHAWHLAEASVEPDEWVAQLLDQVAHRMLSRGDVTGAVTAFTRAASLSRIPANRARRVAEAAYRGAHSGELETVSQLLAVARQADPGFTGSLRDASAAAFLILSDRGDVFTAHQLLVAAVRSHPNPCDAEDNSLIEALHTLFMICVFAGVAELWQPFHDAVSGLAPHAPADLMLRHAVCADPARVTTSALAHLDCLVADLRRETDLIKIIRTSHCARFVDRLNLCREPLWRIVRDPAASGIIKANALRDLCLDDFSAGQWEDAERLADEGIKLTGGQDPRPLISHFRYVLALLAAVRGDEDVNRALCNELTSWAAPRRALGIQRCSLHARALAAIGRGHYEDAFRLAAAVSPPGEFASHISDALFICLDLVEAAVRTNRRKEAHAHVAAMRQERIAALSPRLALLVAGSAALVAPDHVAGEHFEKALALRGTDRWPFDRARVQLAYGEHLRRNGAASGSRAHLSEALGVFQRLGARPWANRAGNELRATGQLRVNHHSPQAGALTPQEQTIAALAASGMSNKQIAERLYLSHRTVENHLHRVFPKLGITSRAGLRDALTPDRTNSTSPHVTSPKSSCRTDQ